MVTSDIAKRFLRNNFHDAFLKGIHIEPAGDRRSKSTVQVVLEDYDTDELIQIHLYSQEIFLLLVTSTFFLIMQGLAILLIQKPQSTANPF